MRSTLIFVSHRRRVRNNRIHGSLLLAGIHLAYRAGSPRIARHLHNDDACIDRALSMLNGACAQLSWRRHS